MKRQFLILLLCAALGLSACGSSAPGTAETRSQAGVGSGETALRDDRKPVAPQTGAAATTPMLAPTTAPQSRERAAPAVAGGAGGDASLNFGSAPGSTNGAPAATMVPGGHPLPENVTAEPGTGSVPPVNQLTQAEALRAGEADDNIDFEAYLEYLQSYGGPPARVVDVRERLIIAIINDKQQPVLDAHVQLYDADRLVFEGRTYASGRTIVFPRTLGLSEGTTSLRIRVEKAGQQNEGTLELRGEGTQSESLVLPGVESAPATPRLDVLFLLDSTGSMADEIGQLQSTIVSIAERIDHVSPRPELRFALVTYRDRGDDYVTQGYDFTSDVLAFRKTLLGINAGGGGDEPEALNEALHNAIHRVSWSEDAVRLVFLIADAPPHLDYPEDYDYVEESRAAVAAGIKIFPIAASNTNEQAEYVFRQLAQQTMGSFIFLTYQPGQNSGPVGDTTVHNVDPAQFTVERLDDLVVAVIERELARAQGH